MITQEQIDARDEYIKSLEYAVIEFSDGTAFRNYKNERKSIADADKEAADAEIIAMVFEDKPEDLRDAQKPIIYNCKNNLYCGASADDPYICCYSCSQKNGCPYICPLDEQDKGIHCYGGNISMCEGSRCDDAYDAYCEQQATEVNQ